MVYVRCAVPPPGEAAHVITAEERAGSDGGEALTANKELALALEASCRSPRGEGVADWLEGSRSRAL